MPELCGVDEAGRGPVLGPLVVCGISIPASDEEVLKRIGVRDSKKCTPAQREKMAKEILKVAKCEYVVVQADEIDVLREEFSLNVLEAKVFATLIGILRPTIAYVDSADTDEEEFKRNIMKELDFDVKVVSEHRADETFPVVSAASILAKVRRDKEIRKIEEAIGEPIGSGYPADPVTIAFLERWIREKDQPPPHTRKSWKTARRIIERMKTAKLEEFDSGMEKPMERQESRRRERD